LIAPVAAPMGGTGQLNSLSDPLNRLCLTMKTVVAVYVFDSKNGSNPSIIDVASWRCVYVWRWSSWNRLCL